MKRRPEPVGLLGDTVVAEGGVEIVGCYNYDISLAA
jgi:hypothetical protein